MHPQKLGESIPSIPFPNGNLSKMIKIQMAKLHMQWSYSRTQEDKLPLFDVLLYEKTR